jgi:hypothetical protein
VAEDDRLEGDEALLAALLRGATIVQAASEAGISDRTARRRVKDEEFRRRLDEGRAQVTSMVAAQLAGGAEVGYAVLWHLASTPNTPPSVRRSAARDLIGMASEMGAARDVEARIESLEAALAKLGGAA